MENAKTTAHLVWTTYGSWLPGDARGWMSSGVKGIRPPDPELERSARQDMAGEEVALSAEQRLIVETTIHDHCRVRGWTLHAVSVRTNHIHVVLTAHIAATEAMNQLKAWCSRRLSDAAGLTETVARKAGRRRWFTESGYIVVIASEEQLEAAVGYVAEGQDKREKPTA